MSGTITLVPGSDFGTLIESYKAGLIVEVSLFGSEKAYWASGYEHNKVQSYLKNLIPGDKRRSKANILIDFKQQLDQLNPMLMMQSKSQPKLKYEFTIPLPEGLPSTFLYHGSSMS